MTLEMFASLIRLSHAKPTNHITSSQVYKNRLRAMASPPRLFSESARVFYNDAGEELRVTIYRGHAVLFQSGDVWQTGRYDRSRGEVQIPTLRGPMDAQITADGISFPEANLIKGTWRKLDLMQEFKAAAGSELSYPEISDLWMRDTPKEDQTRISKCEIQVSGARMEGTPALLATTFEDVFRSLQVEIPEKLQQNLEQCGTWARSPTLLEKHVAIAGLVDRDVLCIAPVGSGQTRAFLLPMLCRMMSKLQEPRATPKMICFPDTLVICSTQEAASECHRIASSLLRDSHFRCVCLRRQSITEQVRDLALGVDVLVATPASLGEVPSTLSKLHPIIYKSPRFMCRRECDTTRI